MTIKVYASSYFLLYYLPLIAYNSILDRQT